MNRLLPTREFLLRIGVEFVIVFMGVTLAFVFDSYRQGVQQDRRRDQIEQALLHDIANYDTIASAYVNYMRDGMATVERMRSEGKRPVPFVLRIEGAERPPTDVWEAAMASGAGELLEPDVILILASFYNEIEGESAKYERYAVFTEQRVFPLLESDTTAFYDSAGDLKPEFKGHARQLEEIVRDLEAQTRTARRIREQLAARLQ